tara:strand:- start:462 stop:1247 length:786 start_codon:yes stop_codon:yes gene_type:complete
MKQIKRITRLNENQIERFSRQILINEIGSKGQIKLINTPIIVIGCGGLGTTVATYLSMLGINNLGLADHDTVSLSNLNRQTLFNEKDIDNSKVKVIKKKLHLINSDINLKIYDKEITTKNINNIIKNYKIVLDCTDNFKSRYLINDACFKNKKILISAALHGFEIQLFCFKAWINTKNPCYRCIFPQNDLTENIGNCNSFGIISSVAGLGGLFQSLCVVKAILKKDQLMYNEFLLYDCLNLKQRKISYQKDPNCSLCKVYK